MRRLTAAVCLALLSTSALAAPDPARKQAERALFEQIVEIPTVSGRGQMPRLTKLLTAEFRKEGITNVIVKDHDKTQTLIARWPAAKPSGKKPILLMAHMDVVEADPKDWKYDPFTSGSLTDTISAAGQATIRRP
jgi:acetylornithine deacetylase/succinyl-diaminopimelate desuccinylase-like protein